MTKEHEMSSVIYMVITQAYFLHSSFNLEVLVQ